MFKGPKGPVSGQTSRTIAEQKNNPSNFTEGPAYDVAKGVPSGMPGASGQYTATEVQPNLSAKPLDIPAPFTIKGG